MHDKIRDIEEIEKEINKRWDSSYRDDMRELAREYSLKFKDNRKDETVDPAFLIYDPDHNNGL